MPHDPTALQFSVQCQFLAAASELGGKRRFSGIAYAGGVIRDHGYWSDGVAFDLDTTEIPKKPLPLLFQHSADRPIGVIENVTFDGGQIALGGFFLDTADALNVIALADQGYPWELSVGIYPTDVVQLREPLTNTTQQLPAGIALFKNNRLREVSIVTIGADDGTKTNIFNSQPQQEPSMDLATALAKIDELQAQVSAQQAELDQFKAAERVTHEARVKQLFTDTQQEFSAEAAAPWLAMTATQFTAAAALVRKTQPAAGVNSSLFSHQALAGRTDVPQPLDSANVYAARRVAQ